MKQNIYDNSTFFNKYRKMRIEKKGMSANDVIEIPTIRKIIPNLMNKKILELGCGFGDNCEFFLTKGQVMF